MIMLSLDAVIMMAHNCWCALAAAQRPPTSRSLSVYLSMYLLTSFPSINLAFISLTVSPLCLNLFLFSPLSSLIQMLILLVKRFDVI